MFGKETFGTGKQLPFLEELQKRTHEIKETLDNPVDDLPARRKRAMNTLERMRELEIVLKEKASLKTSGKMKEEGSDESSPRWKPGKKSREKSTLDPETALKSLEKLTTDPIVLTPKAGLEGKKTAWLKTLDEIEQALVPPPYPGMGKKSSPEFETNVALPVRKLVAEARQLVEKGISIRPQNLKGLTELIYELKVQAEAYEKEAKKLTGLLHKNERKFVETKAELTKRISEMIKELEKDSRKSFEKLESGSETETLKETLFSVVDNLDSLGAKDIRSKVLLVFEKGEPEILTSIVESLTVEELAGILSHADGTSQDKISNHLVPAFESEPEKLVSLISAMISEITELNPNAFLRSNILATKLMAKQNLVVPECRDYISGTAAGALQDVEKFCGKLSSVELDPEKLLETEKEGFEEKKPQIVKAYTDALDSFLAKISKMEIPEEIRIMCRVYYSSFSDRFIEGKILEKAEAEELNGSAFNLVGGHLFLRLISPAISTYGVSGKLSGFDAYLKKDKKFKRSVILFSKVLQYLSNGVTKVTKEMYLQVFDNWLAKNKPVMRNILQRAIEPPEEKPEISIGRSRAMAMTEEPEPKKKEEVSEETPTRQRRGNVFSEDRPEKTWIKSGKEAVSKSEVEKKHVEFILSLAEESFWLEEDMVLSEPEMIFGTPKSASEVTEALDHLGLELQYTVTNGNCMYDGVDQQLEESVGIGTLRKTLGAFLKNESNFEALKRYLENLLEAADEEVSRDFFKRSGIMESEEVDALTVFALKIIDDIETDKKWDGIAGDLAPMLLPYILGRNVQVISPNGGNMTHTIGGESVAPFGFKVVGGLQIGDGGKPIVLAYNGRSHYMGSKPKDN
jgi:hypothetical protein